ncbi:MAG: hypothetical protein GX589_08615 [Deltaproteobacteria bacterium]|jgi:hypothetical protein|nr:hypothetical protein [Deltaproteobacteria bacterium]
MMNSERARLLEEVWCGKPVHRHLREFGLLFGLIFIAVSIYCLAFSQNPLFSAVFWFVLGVVVLCLGFLAPFSLYYPWKVWMAFANVLGRVIHPLIMFLLWTIAVLPTALILKICGKRVIDLRFRAPVESYWEDRSPASHDFKLLRKQY